MIGGGGHLGNERVLRACYECNARKITYLAVSNGDEFNFLKTAKSKLEETQTVLALTNHIIFDTFYILDLKVTSLDIEIKKIINAKVKMTAAQNKLSFFEKIFRNYKIKYK